MSNISPLQTLSIVEFRNLLSGRFLLILAFRMLATLLGWWVYQLTKDPFSIGLIGLSEVVPAVSCALYAGHFIDMNEKIINRMSAQKHKLKNLLNENFNENLSERDNMINNGYRIYYDTGNLVYHKKY